MVTRVQGPFRGVNAANMTYITITLDSTPVSGNIIILVIGNRARTVTGITQTNVNWSTGGNGKQVNKTLSGANDVEIWIGTASEGAGKIITATVSGGVLSAGYLIGDACEYANLVSASSALDKTATNTSTGTASDTGTTASTSQQSELWIGGIFASAGSSQTQTTPTNNFTLLDGVNADEYRSLAYLEKIVTATGTANSGTTIANSGDAWVGCIATFKCADVIVTGFWTEGHDFRETKFG